MITSFYRKRSWVSRNWRIFPLHIILERCRAGIKMLALIFQIPHPVPLMSLKFNLVFSTFSPFLFFSTVLTILSSCFPFIMPSASSFSTLLSHFSHFSVTSYSLPNISFLTFFVLFIPNSLILHCSPLMMSPLPHCGLSQVRTLPHLSFSTSAFLMSLSKLEVVPRFKH